MQEDIYIKRYGSVSPAKSRAAQYIYKYIHKKIRTYNVEQIIRRLIEMKRRRKSGRDRRAFPSE